MKVRFCNIQKLTKIQDILCLALSSDDIENRKSKFLDLYSPKIDIELFKQAQIDEVASHVAYLKIESNIKLTEAWQNIFNKVKREIDNLLDELDLVADKLSKKDIKIVALKNAGIARAVYKNSACSPMGDIDLLVSIKDFKRAHKILVEELNYTFKFRSEFEEEDLETAFKHGGTEYFKIVNDYKIWLELQWRPIAGRWINRSLEPDGEKLINDSIEVSDSAVRILNPVDNLLQVSLHTAKHSYVRAPGFRLHSDVDRIVRYSQIDWELFVSSVKRLRVSTAVYFSLGIASVLLNTPIPSSVFQKLQPNIIRGNIIKFYIRKANIFNQREKKFSKIGYIIFNIALYDSITIFLNSLFLSESELRNLYGYKNKMYAPYFYLKRTILLIFQRAKL